MIGTTKEHFSIHLILNFFSVSKGIVISIFSYRELFSLQKCISTSLVTNNRQFLQRALLIDSVLQFYLHFDIYFSFNESKCLVKSSWL